MKRSACPRCGYALEGLPESDRVRCPECGGVWRWSEVVRHARRALAFRNARFWAACAVPLTAVAALCVFLLVAPKSGGFNFLVLVVPVAGLTAILVVVVAASLWAESPARQVVLSIGMVVMGLVWWAYALVVILVPHF